MLKKGNLLIYAAEQNEVDGMQMTSSNFGSKLPDLNSIKYTVAEVRTRSQQSEFVTVSLINNTLFFNRAFSK